MGCKAIETDASVGCVHCGQCDRDNYQEPVDNYDDYSDDYDEEDDEE